MTLTDHLRTTATRPVIVARLFVGLVCLTIAVLQETRYAEQVTNHGDGLMTVGLAAVGGLAMGSALESIRERAARRQVPEKSSATSA
jgi:hypothetical protein